MNVGRDSEATPPVQPHAAHAACEEDTEPCRHTDPLWIDLLWSAGLATAVLFVLAVLGLVRLVI